MVAILESVMLLIFKEKRCSGVDYTVPLNQE